MTRSSNAGVEEMVEGTDFFQRIQSDISQFYSSPRQPEEGTNPWCQTISQSLCWNINFPIVLVLTLKIAYGFLRLFIVFKLNFNKKF
jgi:hypothetical protein